MLWLELDENAACKVLKQTTFKSQKDDFKDEAEASMEVMIILRDDRVKNPEMINIMSVGSAVESSESAL